VSKDYDIETAFQAGGLPSFSSVTLKAARIEATDSNGDISFISGANISVSSRLMADALIATLPAPPAAGTTSVQLQIIPKELKPYLQAGGIVTASINYSPTPVTARALKLVLTIHGSLF
jgi:hypothetical protein